jgi:flagellar L-ring protein precursor FlgH
MHLLLLILLSAPLCAESLWQAETLAEGNLYADATARRRGDILTIVIQETTSISDGQKTDTKRDNSVDAHLDLLTGLNETPAAQGQPTTNRLPALKAGSAKKFAGEAKYEMSSAVKSTIAVQVVDVLDNGSMIVQGARQVLVNEDRKTIQVSGIVRPGDVRSDNTVLSEKLYDMRVAITGEGPAARSQQEGWLGRMLDVLWPF